MPCSLGIPPRERPELGNEVRVGKKPHIENQVRILRHSMLESEADAGNQNVSARLFFLEEFSDMAAQFVNVETGRMNHQVGHRPDLLQTSALRLRRGFKRRMCP